MDFDNIIIYVTVVGQLSYTSINHLDICERPNLSAVLNFLVLSYTPYSKMAANKLFSCLHLN